MAARTTANISRLPFVADPHSIMRNSGRQVDWAALSDSYRETVSVTQVVDVGAAGAAQGATSVPVNALTYKIFSGTTLDFGGAKFARLTADAEAGATALTVTALVTALVDADVATHTTTAATGPKILRAGTVVGELAGSGKLRPRVVTSNPATGIMETTAREGDTAAALTGYGVIIGGHLYENLLPDASGSPKTLAGAIKTELNANGFGFSFEQYGDSR